MWYNLTTKIISAINVKMITLINLVQKDISSSFEKIHHHRIGIKKKIFISRKNFS